VENQLFQMATHKSGFVNIVGNPNVGKSTLMNALVGERISIITSKAQTTRHRITGIVNGDDYQIVFSDTPGVLKPNYKLQESMLSFSVSALTDADVLLYITDTVEKIDKHADFIAKVQKMDIPVLGIVENYSYLECPDCGKKLSIFGESKIDAVADEMNLPVLGKLPIVSRFAELADKGAFDDVDNPYLEEAVRVITR
jgi:small GTP-binding protein